MAGFTRDFLVFGSGIAGLWIYNDLIQKGFSVSLIESGTLGGVQTLGSQGMIHGGQKYTLTGHVADVASNVAKMPALWSACLSGHGLVDLSTVKVLADEQVMWPDNKLLSGAASFAAAKSVNGETKALSAETLPELLKLHGVKTGYALHEVVMNTKSLVTALSQTGQDEIYKARLTGIVKDGDGIDQVVLTDDSGREISVKAKAYIFACGKGNEDVLSMLGETERVTQCRPLRQVMARGLPYPVFGHCVTANPKPRVTITSYQQDDGRYIWYLGGNIAEKGVKMDENEQIHFADKEMRTLFPKLDWDTVEWATWDVDRAEAHDKDGHLPPGPQMKEYGGNTLVIWPTKMTFAPALSICMAGFIEKRDIKAGAKGEALPFSAPEQGVYPWEAVKEWKHVA